MLDLSRLHTVYRPGLTSAIGEVLSEAAAVCLDEENHPSGTQIYIFGSYNNKHVVVRPIVTPQMRRAHADPLEATEHGACGMAILIVEASSNLTVVERSRIGTGFDYWLGDKKTKGPYFQKARLEVSGIRRGTTSNVSRRIREKIQQVSRVASPLPARIVVVEFGSPQAQVHEI